MKARDMSEALKGQRFGVEVEMCGISRETAARVAADFLSGTSRYTGDRDGYHTFSAIAPDGRKWKFSRDASIYASDSDEQCEMVTPILTYDDIPVLCELVRVLRKHGAKSDPNHGCGVHIHVDGTGHTPQSIKNLCRLMFSHEYQLAQGVNLDGERESRYCKMLDMRFLKKINGLSGRRLTMQAIEDAWYNGSCEASRLQHYNETRYRMLNLHSFFHGHGTVEFRFFQFQNPDGDKKNGLHAGQLRAMIQMALALNNAAKASRSARCKKENKSNASDYFKGWLYRIGFVGAEFKTAKEYWATRTHRTECWETAHNMLRDAV